MYGSSLLVALLCLMLVRDEDDDLAPIAQPIDLRYKQEDLHNQPPDIADFQLEV